MKLISRIFASVLAGIIFVGCTTTAQQGQQAQKLAQEFIIVDGHVDIPYRLNNVWEDISKRTTNGDFDYVRAQEGGLNAPFMSIYIPASYQETGGAKAFADSLINMVEGIATDHPEKFAVATSPDEIKKQFNEGLISLPMGMENGAPLGTNLENVQYFYDRGIRYITLAHSTDNKISDSSYDTTGTHQGLSEFGKDVVREMNRTGIMVDVSHISDNAFYDVMEVAEAPVIASHSSCRHFTPGFERNMSDELIERLAENDGVIMINFGSNFLDSTSNESYSRVQDEARRILQEKDIDPDSEEGEEFQETYFSENYQYSTVQKVADHIDHVVDLVGIEHVGLGSDYDGVGNTLPVGLKDASEYPNLIAELLERDYSEEDIRKMCSGNVFRVWNKVIEIADN